MREIKQTIFQAWDGDDSVSHKDGEYIYVKAEWHPHANKRGYVKRHRLVLERKLGYYIPKRSIVHHKDENKRNDHPDNLELVPNVKIHSKVHDSGVRNNNGQFVACDSVFNDIKFRLFNKHTQQYEIYVLGKLIRTTFRNSQFKFAGRFTGLLDKKGVEIYEGDVLLVPDNYSEFGFMSGEKREVYFYDGGFRFKPKTEYGRGHWIEDDGLFEVIGNIYQNPELLKT